MWVWVCECVEDRGQPAEAGSARPPGSGSSGDKPAELAPQGRWFPPAACVFASVAKMKLLKVFRGGRRGSAEHWLLLGGGGTSGQAPHHANNPVTDSSARTPHPFQPSGTDMTPNTCADKVKINRRRNSS